MRKSHLLFAAFLSAAACSDDTTSICSGSTCAGPAGAPQFAGVASVSPDKTGGRLRVTWAPGADDTTPKEQLTYRLYVSVYAGRATSHPAVLTTLPGATSAYLNVPPGVSYFVTVRAVDAGGLEDGNVLEKSVVATGDNAPPTFAGLKTAVTTPGGLVTLGWDVAADDRTAAEGMRYVVYRAAADGSLTALETLEGRVTRAVVDGGGPGGKHSYLVHAVDAADNVDTNTVMVEGTAGADVTPPVFAGCATAEPLGSHMINVTWSAATDDTKNTAITYEVYVAKGAGAEDFVQKPAVELVGKTSALIRGLDPGTDYHVICRARDGLGNRDANTVEKTAHTTENATAPTFGGATGTLNQDTREVTLDWAAASDDVTTPDKIVYAVYQAIGAGDYDFTTPLVVSDPGATTIKFSNIPSRSDLRWIVRARDADYNEDTNKKETAGKTLTSFELDVQPLYNRNCAVVGCHAAGAVGYGVPFSLAAYDSYSATVSVNAVERFQKDPSPAPPVVYKRVDPGSPATSYLWLKVTGTPGITAQPMPAPGTGTVLSAEQKGIIQTWIEEGAKRN